MGLREKLHYETFNLKPIYHTAFYEAHFFIYQIDGARLSSQPCSYVAGIHHHLELYLNNHAVNIQFMAK